MLWKVPIGEVIREARGRHGLSQGELAYRTRSTQQAISRLERGLVSPSVETLERIATALGEELVVELRPRELPFDHYQLEANAMRSPSERLARGIGWNRFAAEIAAAGARARDQW
jgi:transcriptional regulator with XRE-family HTH domain